MTASDYIAILSMSITTIVSIVGGAYAVANNTKKFELAEAYKKEILEWYSSTVHILTNIIAKMESKNYEDLLSTLSAQIEVGRFYFPNVNKGDCFGKDKPAAYQGYRHIVLNFLVYFYDVAKREDANQYKDVLWEFLRLYTSSVFDIINPRDRIKKIRKYSDFVMDKDISLEDFLQDENNFKRFYGNG